MQPRIEKKCKGKKDGTSCGNVICQTDGKSVFFTHDSGRELEVRPRKALGIVCEKCGYETTWHKDKQ